MHNDSLMPTDYITAAEACEALGGIDRSTLSRWVASGKIAAHKLPGLRGPFLFTRAEIERVKAGKAA